MFNKDLDSISAKTVFIFAFTLLFGVFQLFLFTWNVDKSDLDMVASICFVSGGLVGLGLWLILIKKYLPTWNFMNWAKEIRNINDREKLISSLEVKEDMVKESNPIINLMIGTLLILLGLSLTIFVLWFNFK